MERGSGAIVFGVVVGLFVFLFVLRVITGIGGLAAILAFLVSLWSPASVIGNRP